ncbi:MAG: hypothetical protein ACR2IL_11440, partial [Chitinophagaceae bacterium]
RLPMADAQPAGYPLPSLTHLPRFRFHTRFYFSLGEIQQTNTGSRFSKQRTGAPSLISARPEKNSVKKMTIFIEEIKTQFIR